MFYFIIGGWIIGMVGYVWLSKYNQYNNKNYYDVKKYVRQFKKVQQQLNESTKTFK